MHINNGNVVVEILENKISFKNDQTEIIMTTTVNFLNKEIYTFSNLLKLSKVTVNCFLSNEGNNYKEARHFLKIKRE